MKKEHLTLEFRYNGENGYTNKHLSLGIFDNLKDAVSAGNEALKELSKHFQIRKDDAFSLNGGAFGFPVKLVTNVCYSTDAVKYFLQIKTYNTSIEDAIKSVFED